MSGQVTNPQGTGSRFRRVLTRLSPFAVFSAALALVMCGLVLLPVVEAVMRAFFSQGRLDITALVEVFTAPWLPQVLFNTVVVVGSGGILALIIGSIFAWLNERTDARLGLFGDLMPLIPLLLPNVALSIGWIFLASPDVGFLNAWANALLQPLGLSLNLNITSWGGVIFVYALHFTPYVYLLVATAFRNLDASMEEASIACGAGMWRTLRLISLPAIRPAFLGAFLLIVMTGMSLYSIPVIIATRANIDILSVRIIRSMTYAFPPQPGQAIAMGMILLVIIFFMWILYQRVSSRGRFARITGKGARRGALSLGVWRRPAQAAMIFYLVITSILPMAALLIVALQPFWTPNVLWNTLSLANFTQVLFERQITRDALRNSLLLGSAGGIVVMLIAAVLALFQRRYSGTIGRIVDGITKLPAAFSHIVLAIGFLIAFGAAPFYLAGTLTILFLTYLVLYMPEASVSAGAALSQISEELMEASAVSGASEMRTFGKIVVPLVLPGLVAGWSLVFVLISGEITAASLLAGAGTPVIGQVLLDIWEAGDFGTLAALACIITVISILAITAGLLVTRIRFAKLFKWRTG